MTIHQYLLQASKDDARRASLKHPRGPSLVALVTRGGRLLSRWTGWAQVRLGKRARRPADYAPM